MMPVMKAFRQFLRSEWEDFMVVACIVGPIFMGVAFCIGIPILESYLCDWFHQEGILTPYYRFFDLLLLMMTPLLVSFAGVMVMLEEIDNTTAKYLCVTPLGPKGYLLSRLGIPTLISVLYDGILIMLCGISDMDIITKIIVIIQSGIISIVVSIMVVGFAKNKVEGMALMKLSGLLIAAVLLPFFVDSYMVFLAGVFPSFWIGYFVRYVHYPSSLIFLVVSVIWILGLFKRFQKKLS